MKIATYNINFDQESWPLREDAIADQLNAQQLDVICLQEIAGEDTAEWLAAQLGMPYFYTTFRTQAGKHGVIHGITTLSRFPFVSQRSFYFEEQGRVCHVVEVMIEGRQVAICNGHYYWEPEVSPVRFDHVYTILNWLEREYPQSIKVLAGDFNEEPQYTAISLIKWAYSYKSAYEATHRVEAPFTCDSSRMPPSNWKRQILQFLGFKWRGTLDYIFYDPETTKVDSCRLLTVRTPEGMHASDHSAIVAELLFK